MHLPESGDRLLDGVDHGIWRRSARRDADCFSTDKPLEPQILCMLNVVNTSAVARTGVHEFTGIVAVRAADNDDHVALLREFDGRVLALFGRLTNGVAKRDFRPWESRPNAACKVTNAFSRLCCLRNDSETRTLAERGDVFFSENDIKLVEITSESPHFDVFALADNDGMKSARHQITQHPMSVMHQRARGFDDVEPTVDYVSDGALGTAVRGDDDGVGFHLCQVGGKTETPVPQRLQNGIVVDEFAENCGRLAFGLAMRERDGVANPETHAKMSGAKDLHRI